MQSTYCSSLYYSYFTLITITVWTILYFDKNYKQFYHHLCGSVHPDQCVAIFLFFFVPIPVQLLLSVSNKIIWLFVLSDLSLVDSYTSLGVTLLYVYILWMTCDVETQPQERANFNTELLKYKIVQSHCPTNNKLFE